MPQLLEKPETTLARIRARKRVYWALGGAVGIHLILLTGAASVIPLIPDASKLVQPKEKPFNLTIDRPDEPSQMEPEPEKKRDYIETNPDQASDRPPDEATFES